MDRYSDDMPASHRFSVDGRCIPTRELRYVLTSTLVGSGHRMTVSELVRAVETLEISIAGRPTKVVFDALRAEVARGRVRRVSWGLYEGGTMPASTWRHVRRRARIAVANYQDRVSRVV